MSDTVRVAMFEKKVAELGYIPEVMYMEVLETNRKLEFQNLQLQRQRDKDQNTIQMLVEANTMWSKQCDEYHTRLLALGDFDRSIEKLIKLYIEKA